MNDTYIHELVDGTGLTGRYRVSTEHSEYHVDFDRREFTRMPAHGEASKLHGDLDAIKFGNLIRCELGKPMHVTWRSVSEGPKLRTTTPVTEIVALP